MPLPVHAIPKLPSPRQSTRVQSITDYAERAATMPAHHAPIVTGSFVRAAASAVRPQDADSLPSLLFFLSSFFFFSRSFLLSSPLCILATSRVVSLFCRHRDGAPRPPPRSRQTTEAVRRYATSAQRRKRVFCGGGVSRRMRVEGGITAGKW